MNGLLEQQRFHIERIIRLDEIAERVEISPQHLLDLQQKQITIQMARDTERPSAALKIFTIVTVIFAPLAFMVALFALKVDSFLMCGKSWSVAVTLIGGKIVTLSLMFFGWHGYGKYWYPFKNHGSSRTTGEKISKDERSDSYGNSGVAVERNEILEKRGSSFLRERRKVVGQDPSDRV